MSLAAPNSQGVYSSETLSRMDFEEEKGQGILQLKKGVSFYKWQQESQELTVIPATSEDLKFSVERMRENWTVQGYGSYWDVVQGIEIVDDQVQISFDSSQLARAKSLFVYIIVQTVLLPEEIYADVDFQNPSFETFPVGAGRYYLKQSDISKSGDDITYRRVNNH